jgi:hypothetical protein
VVGELDMSRVDLIEWLLQFLLPKELLIEAKGKELIGSNDLRKEDVISETE